MLAEMRHAAYDAIDMIGKREVVQIYSLQEVARRGNTKLLLIHVFNVCV